MGFGYSSFSRQMISRIQLSFDPPLVSAIHPLVSFFLTPERVRFDKRSRKRSIPVKLADSLRQALAPERAFPSVLSAYMNRERRAAFAFAARSE